jgi:hypothetical protein
MAQLRRYVRLQLQVDCRIVFCKQHVLVNNFQRVAPLDDDLLRRAIHLKL